MKIVVDIKRDIEYYLAMLIREQAKPYLEQIVNRKRSPVTASTLRAYKSYLNRWVLPVIGNEDLKDVRNGVIKRLVATVAGSGMKPATVYGVLQVVRGILESVTDADGERVYKVDWNMDFIDAAPVVARDQDAPVITLQGLQESLKSTAGRFHTLLVLLAGSGLRISEARALKAGPEAGFSYWDRKRSVLVINSALDLNGRETSTKTPAGVREVDLAPELNEFLKAAIPETSGYIFVTKGKPSRQNDLYDAAKAAGIPGFHSLRRFRETFLDNVGTPRGLMKFWTGHANQDVTDRYVKSGADIQARKEWAQKIGLGFQLEAR